MKWKVPHQWSGHETEPHNADAHSSDLFFISWSTTARRASPSSTKWKWKCVINEQYWCVSVEQKPICFCFACEALSFLLLSSLPSSVNISLCTHSACFYWDWVTAVDFVWNCCNWGFLQFEIPHTVILTVLDVLRVRSRWCRENKNMHLYLISTFLVVTTNVKMRSRLLTCYWNHDSTKSLNTVQFVFDILNVNYILFNLFPG